MCDQKIKGVVLLGNRRCEVREFPLRKPGPGELLLRVKAAGICGSDLHDYRGTPAEMGPRLGVVIGHEPSGTVHEVGPEVTEFRVGDRITVNHTLGCGHCEYCLEGETVLCSQKIGISGAGYGADAEFTLMPASACFHLPNELSFIEGTFIACTGATAYNALRKLSLSGHDKVAIFGLGPVGLAALLVGKALGATIYGIDIIHERIALARQLGADETINAAKDNPQQIISSLTQGRGVDSVLETSGSPNGQSDAVEVVCPRGKVAFVGMSKGVKSISPEQFMQKEAVLFGSKVMPGNRYWEMTRFMIDQNLRFEQIVTHRMRLEDSPSAFAQFDAGAPGKFILEME